MSVSPSLRIYLKWSEIEKINKYENEIDGVFKVK